MSTIEARGRSATTQAAHHGGSRRLATVFLTSDCNLNCPYCYARENPFSGAGCDTSAILPLFEGLAAEGYNLSIGGGEPLTRYPEVLQVAREAGRRGMGVSLLSNGHLLDTGRLRELRDAGVCWIQISADSAKEVEHFAPILSAGATMSIRMAVGTVLLPERVQEIASMHALLAARGASGWRILRYTQLKVGPGKTQPVSTKEWLRMLIEVERRLRPQGSEVQIRYEPSVVPLAWLQSLPAGESLDVCGGRSARRIFLYPDGAAFACGLPRRDGIFLGDFRLEPSRFREALAAGPPPESVPRTDEDRYCREVCRGGCLQMRGALPCDPRCEWDERLVPVCCYEKLLLSPGRHTAGTPVYPSDLFRGVEGAS